MTGLSCAMLGERGGKGREESRGPGVAAKMPQVQKKAGNQNGWII